MNDAETMIIKYWGVRGSIPTPLTTEKIRDKEIALISQLAKDGGIEKLFGNNPDPEKIREYLCKQPLSISGTYGGDTTCIEVQARDSPLIIIDAGTGARELGNGLLKRLFSGDNLNSLNSEKQSCHEMHIFFSHYHWDHIQGFPFFGPAFISGEKCVKINFYGKKNAKARLSHVLQGQQQYPNFPVEWQALPCKKDYHELGRMEPQDIKLGASTVRYTELNHPDRVLGYSIENNGKKFVCATDTEHNAVIDPFLVKLAKCADILYYDGQYSPEEYSGDEGMPKVRWGHSTYEWAIKTAISANVSTIVIGHLEPTRDDFGMEKILERGLDYRDEILKLPENEGKKLEVIIAYQGLEQRL